MGETAKDWILKQKLSNYGYDRKSWQRMTGYKSRVFKKLRQTPDPEIRKALAKAGILGKGRRFEKVPQQKVVVGKDGKKRYKNTGKAVWDYTTGQSFNEELINMATIGATKGKKSFWEVQNRWWD